MKWLVVCVALLLGLSACDGDAGATADPTTFSPTATGLDTPSSAATTTPTAPVEPTLPAAAKAPTKAGAEAFVRYYWELVNYAQETGRTDTLRDLHMPSCDACAGGVDWIDQVYRRGGRITGGTHAVNQAQAVPTGQGARFWVVEMGVSVTRQRVSDAGDLSETYPAGEFSARFVIDFAQHDWRVASWSEQ